ncbi:MAG: hypothetical protein JWM64_664 [Frankiales bacterium]|nr:hypothetical protein [Frankiales bacterium]
MGSDYVFRTVWRVPGTPMEVATVLADAASLPRWWPSVYLAVEVLETPDTETGHGAVARLHTTGWLPYTLTWTLTITSPITVEGFSLSAVGDLEGTGVWTFREDGPETEVVYDWQVRAGKPLLRRWSWLLRPAFEANHHWAMRKGEQSLALELRRRRGGDVPPPPRATWR